MHIRSPILPLFTALALSCHHEPDATPPASPGVPAATSPAASPTAARSDSEVALSAQVLASLRHRGLAAHTVELTLRPGLQAAADEVVTELATAPDAVSASLVALDPSTGEIVALSGRTGASLDVSLAARQVATPGSVMKSFSVAAALDLGRVTTSRTFDGPGSLTIAGGTIRDQQAHAPMTVGDILAFSSNVGAAQVGQAIGPEALAAAYHRLGFGEAPGVELDDVAAGSLPAASDWTPLVTARIASGGEARVSPLQVAAAFATIASGGTYRSPTLVRRALREDGTALTLPGRRTERVLRDETARTMIELLEGVVQRDDATGTQARITGQRVAGKTGTMPLTIDGREGAHASFVGVVTSRSPRLVVMVTVDTTRAGYTGGTVAAPAFQAFAARAISPSSP